MNFIIYDLEATCWEHSHPGLIQETIEIGAIKIDRFGQIVDRFDRFIKPDLHPFLSPFCKRLTKIDQAVIDSAEKFDRVVTDFQDWIEIDLSDYRLCAWGKFDQTQLIEDCRLHKIEEDWLDHFINVRNQYARIKNGKLLGMQQALKKERFEFTGIAHRAIYDAENLSKIFLRYIEDWELY